MSNRSLSRLVPVMAVPILMFTGCAFVRHASPSDQPATVQSVADRVSQKHYEKYQVDVETMGLGALGGLTAFGRQADGTALGQPPPAEGSAAGNPVEGSSDGAAD